MIHLCNTCGCKDAESFDAEVYAIEDGGKTELSFQELFDYLNSAIDNEYFLTKGERDDYYEKNYREYEAESFEGESPMMKNITAIGVLALAIIIGKKIKR